MPAYINIIERIERHAGELRDDECWETDFHPSGGSSRLYVNLRERGGRTNSLHRIAWEAHNAEPIPEGMLVMHTCDNPACFNPAHLVLGTDQDNMDDKCRKGRHRGGIGRPDAPRDANGRFCG